MIFKPKNSPYNLDNKGVYSAWREQKLALYPATAEDLLVTLSGDPNTAGDEYAAMQERLADFNMVVYAHSPIEADEPMASKKFLNTLIRRFGLLRLDAHQCADDDSISLLSVAEGGERKRYIPYSNRAISWHTDGYYNTPDHQIRGMGLHCIHPAADGGDNQLMDPEIAYILLRDENPDFIRALMHPDAMLIPENDLGDGEIRPPQGGPVFSIADDGSLHMRYTARTRSIEWRDDATTRGAVDFLTGILSDDSPYVFHHRMSAGEGVVCNNVLHNRTSFVDDDENKRLVLRARSYDRCVKELDN